MKIFGIVGLSFTVAATDLIGDADLVLKTNQNGGFTGDLKVFLAKNCEIEPPLGRICDYHFQQIITDLHDGGEYTLRLKDQVDAGSDQLLLTYRSEDEAIFDAMELLVHIVEPEAEIKIDLMNLEGGGEDHSVFDYDSQAHPCNSFYPRSSKCKFDTIYDLKQLHALKDISLFSGHVENRQKVMATWVNTLFYVI